MGDGVSDRRAEGGAVGAGGIESGAVGGILDGIRKGEQFFVLVEGGGIQHADHGTGETGGLRPGWIGHHGCSNRDNHCGQLGVFDLDGSHF